MAHETHLVVNGKSLTFYADGIKTKTINAKTFSGTDEEIPCIGDFSKGDFRVVNGKIQYIDDPEPPETQAIWTGILGFNQSDNTIGCCGINLNQDFEDGVFNGSFEISCQLWTFSFPISYEFYCDTKTFSNATTYQRSDGSPNGIVVGGKVDGGDNYLLIAPSEEQQYNMTVHSSMWYPTKFIRIPYEVDRVSYFVI